MTTRYFLIGLLLLLQPFSAAALEVVPFYTRNQSPLVQVYGLPAAEGGWLAPEGRVESRLVLDIANVFTGGTAERETLRLDGETYRLTLALRYGLGENFEIGVDLPFVRHEGGRFDVLIDTFHRTFGFSEGGRDKVDRDRLRYLSIWDGEAQLEMQDATSGVGDILLSAGWQISRGGALRPRGVALRGAVKLPTGDPHRLMGSGSTDVSLRIIGTDAASLAAWNMTWYGGGGVLWMSEGDVLPERRRDLVGFGTLGIGWTPRPWWGFKVQLDGHTPFYRSELREIGISSLQAVVGMTFALPGGFLFDIGLSEDLIVATAPDAVFHFGLRRIF